MKEIPMYQIILGYCFSVLTLMNAYVNWNEGRIALSIFFLLGSVMILVMYTFSLIRMKKHKRINNEEKNEEVS